MMTTWPGVMYAAGGKTIEVDLDGDQVGCQEIQRVIGDGGGGGYGVGLATNHRLTFFTANSSICP